VENAFGVTREQEFGYLSGFTGHYENGGADENRPERKAPRFKQRRAGQMLRSTRREIAGRGF